MKTMTLVLVMFIIFVSLNSDEYFDMYFKAQMLYAHKNFDESLMFIDSLFNNVELPDNIVANLLSLKSYNYYHLEEFTMALSTLEKLEDIEPQIIDIYILRVNIYKRLEDTLNASKYISIINEAKLFESIGLLRRCYFYIHNSEYEKALNDINNIIILSKQDHEFPHMLRGWVFTEQENYEDAVSEFEHALTFTNLIDEQKAWIEYMLSISYWELGLNEKSLENFNSADSRDYNFNEPFFLHLNLYELTEKDKLKLTFINKE